MSSDPTPRVGVLELVRWKTFRRHRSGRPRKGAPAAYFAAAAVGLPGRLPVGVSASSHCSDLGFRVARSQSAQ